MIRDDRPLIVAEVDDAWLAVDDPRNILLHGTPTAIVMATV